MQLYEVSHVTVCQQAEDEGREAFLNLAGEDGEIDAYELRNILNSVFIKGNVCCHCHIKFNRANDERSLGSILMTL